MLEDSPQKEIYTITDGEDPKEEERIEETVQPPQNGEIQQPRSIMTPRKYKILASIIYGNLFLGSCYSLMAPIFPAEAEKKGASASAYGLVFGIYQLVMFVSAPVYGKLMIYLKPGYMMKGGMLLSGICVMSFSFLDDCPPGPAFIWISMGIRVLDALGASAFLTASYTTLGVELKDFIGRAMSVVETAYAVGLAIGPVIGGVLYQAGGFRLPFLVVGALLLTGTIANMFLFSNTDDIPVTNVSAIKLLSNIDFIIDVLSISSCFAMLGFNEATLEPHLRQFHLSPASIGGIFLISGLMDAVISPFLGCIAEKMPNAQYLTTIGGVSFIACFLIVGPVPLLNFSTSMPVVIVSQFLLGIGMAGKIVSSFTHGMKHTVQRGFPDDVGTYGLVSGLLFSSACFGAFIGPSVGGYLIDSVGYENSTAVIVVFEFIMTMICISRLIYLTQRQSVKQTNQTQAERSHL